MIERKIIAIVISVIGIPAVMEHMSVRLDVDIGIIVLEAIAEGTQVVTALAHVSHHHICLAVKPVLEAHAVICDTVLLYRGIDVGQGIESRIHRLALRICLKFENPRIPAYHPAYETHIHGILLRFGIPVHIIFEIVVSLARIEDYGAEMNPLRIVRRSEDGSVQNLGLRIRPALERSAGIVIPRRHAAPAGRRILVQLDEIRRQGHGRGLAYDCSGHHAGCRSLIRKLDHRTACIHLARCRRRRSRDGRFPVRARLDTGHRKEKCHNYRVYFSSYSHSFKFFIFQTPYPGSMTRRNRPARHKCPVRYSIWHLTTRPADIQLP